MSSNISSKRPNNPVASNKEPAQKRSKTQPHPEDNGGPHDGGYAFDELPQEPSNVEDDDFDEFGDIFITSDQQASSQEDSILDDLPDSSAEPSVAIPPPSSGDIPQEVDLRANSNALLSPDHRDANNLENRHIVALRLVSQAFPSHRSEIAEMFSAVDVRPNSDVDDAWQKRWNTFCKEEPAHSGKPRIDLCKPTGSLRAHVLIQLNHPTHVCERKPGTTLDKKCASTRVLLQKGVTSQNCFTLDTFNRRCAVRRVQTTNGVLERTFKTEPSTWPKFLIDLHISLMTDIWSMSAGKVVLVSGAENRQNLVKALDLDLKSIEIEDGVNVNVALWRIASKISKVLVFVWHPEFPHRSRKNVAIAQSYDAMINFGFNLARVPIQQDAWQTIVASAAAPLEKLLRRLLSCCVPRRLP